MRDANAFRFESVAFPNHFLQYCDGDLVIAKSNGSYKDKILATWLLGDISKFCSDFLQ